MVDGATLEKSCSARNLGFESLTLRQKTRGFPQFEGNRFFISVQKCPGFPLLLTVLGSRPTLLDERPAFL